MTDRVQHHVLNNPILSNPTSNSQQSMALPHLQGQQQQQQPTSIGHSTANHWHKDGSAVPPKLRGKRRATTPASSDLDKPQQIGIPSTSTTTPMPAMQSVIPNDGSPTSSSSTDTSSSSALQFLSQQQHRSQVHNSISIVSPGSPSAIVQSPQQQQLLDQQSYRPPKLQKVHHPQPQFPVGGGTVPTGMDPSQQQRHQLAPIVIPTPRHYHPGQPNQILLTATGKCYVGSESGLVTRRALRWFIRRMEPLVGPKFQGSCALITSEGAGPRL